MPTLPFELDESEVAFSAIRAQGAGGQNVNKVSNAVHLRFDLQRSTLPAGLVARVLALGDQRVTREGVVVIKAQGQRSLEANRTEALGRLRELLERAAEVPRVRRPTRPTRGSQRRRLEAKTQRGEVKALRGRVTG